MKNFLILCLFSTFCLSLSAQKVASEKIVSDTLTGVVEDVIVVNELTYIKFKGTSDSLLLCYHGMKFSEYKRTNFYKKVLNLKNKLVSYTIYNKNKQIVYMEEINEEEEYIGIDPMFQ